jgi:cellulose synthase/poly-beta-1,6-N-acetylglucosamine synthase-like glycosyltransferase
MLYLLINSYKMKHLKAVAVKNGEQLPSVSVVIAVRNEEEHLEKALQSVCQLIYPQLEVIVVNDRSTDRTQEILEGMRTVYPFIKLLQINDLPQGWLGKNHALFKGYQQSSNAWLLFTDADVEYQPDTLQKALSFCMDNGTGHMVVLPAVISRSVWLNSVLETFKMMLETRQRPWAASNPKSNASIGIGAFNLVRRDAYEGMGTHKTIAMRPDDDLQLGAKIKKAGFRQNVLYGNDQLGLEWYSNIKEFINGLMKNTFSVFDYNLFKVTGAVLSSLLVFVLPIPVMLITGHSTDYELGLFLLILQSILLLLKNGSSARWWFALMIPYAGILMCYIMIRSAVLTQKQKGIYWRDSFYALSELKAHQKSSK